MVGVGDGPWDDMATFETQLVAENRVRFKNFHFIDYHAARTGAHPYTTFGIEALGCIPGTRHLHLSRAILEKESSFQKYQQFSCPKNLFFLRKISKN